MTRIQRVCWLSGSLLITGCAENPAGVWLFEIESGDGLECEFTLDSHNFLNALEGQGSDPWTESSTTESSSQLLFGQILGDEAEGWTLVMGDRLYTGMGTGTVWTFNWQNREEGSEEETHQLGYRFGHDYGDRLDTEISLTVTDLGITGQVSTSTQTWSSWAETDNWGEPVGVNEGQIPAGDYILVQRGAGGDGPVVEAASNRRDGPDCEGEECELSVTDVCSGTQEIKGSRYSLEEGVPLDLLDGAGEPSGLGSG